MENQTMLSTQEAVVGGTEGGPRPDWSSAHHRGRRRGGGKWATSRQWQRAAAAGSCGCIRRSSGRWGNSVAPTVVSSVPKA